MAPRDTRNGASAAARRTGPKSGPTATSVARARRGGGRGVPRFTWWTTPLAGVLVVAVFGMAYYPVLRVQYREYRDRAQLRAELDMIEARNARLEAQVARLRTPEGVEDYARTQLGLVKRGETFVVVRDPSSPGKRPAISAVPEVDSDNTPRESGDPWTALLDFVFDVE